MDKYLLALLFVLSTLWLIGMPLDAQMFRWSPRFPLLLKIIGSILLIPAFYLLIREQLKSLSFNSSKNTIKSSTEGNINWHILYCTTSSISGDNTADHWRPFSIKFNNWPICWSMHSNNNCAEN